LSIKHILSSLAYETVKPTSSRD